MSDDPLDRLIDDVARQLTEGELSSDFRARVIARIDEGTSPRRTWRAAWMLSPIAAAALIVVAIFVTRGVQPGGRGPAASRERAGTAVGQKEEGQPPTTVTAMAESARKPVSSRPGGSASKVRLLPSPKNGFGGTGKADPKYATSEIDALAPPPLDVPGLVIPSIAAESIPVTPMDTIAPIPVAALTIDVARP